MIELFAKNLPREILFQLTSEFNNKMKETRYLLGKYNYSQLTVDKDLNLIEFLLALSIFYRRVVANIDAAAGFSKNVFNISSAEAIKIGGYNLTIKEKDRMTAMVYKFHAILSNNRVPKRILEYEDGHQFLRAVSEYKRKIENIN